MKKRLNLEKTIDNLAIDMWGDIIEKIEWLSGIIYYKCIYYEGLIVNDKDFKIDKELKRKMNPMTIIEKYTYRKEKFVIERTDRREKVPNKLLKKYENKRYDERISIYVFEDKYMDILKYYHRNILKYLYNNKIDEKSKSYKSLQGYINSETKRIMRYLSLNAPDFVKKKDNKKAKKYLDNILQKRLENLEIEDKEQGQKIEVIEDTILQRVEIL